MSEPAQIPFCSICLEYMTASLQFVVLPRCGHVFCIECADTHFSPPTVSKRCPYCNQPHKRTELIRLFAHERPTRTQASGSTDVSPSQTKASNCSAEDARLIAQGEHIVSSLQRLCDVEPESWLTVFSLQGVDGGQAFLDAQLFLNAVGDAIGRPTLKTALRGLGAALSNLRKMYAAILQLCISRLALEKQLATRKNESRQQERRHNEELQRRDDILSDEKAKQETLKVDLNSRIRGLKARLEKENVARDALEAKLAKFESELQESRAQAIQYKKKYYVVKEELKILKQRKRRNSQSNDNPASDLDIMEVGKETSQPSLADGSTQQTAEDRKSPAPNDLPRAIEPPVESDREAERSARNHRNNKRKRDNPLLSMPLGTTRWDGKMIQKPSRSLVSELRLKKWEQAT